MKILELTLPTTTGNLALDEVLLKQCESASQPSEVLRLWENPVQAVIIGRSSKVAEEVNRQACEENGVPYYRRNSGGAAVAIGPGCLMYALVLDYRRRPELKMLDRAHQFVMQRMRLAIENCGLNVQFQGTCDLTLNGRKFSGNSLRCQRNSFLYHGTLLYDFPLDILHRCLGMPRRQPEYRQRRTHEDFVTNLPVDRDQLRQALVEVWGALQPLQNLDLNDVDQLARRKYSCDQWTNQR